MNKKADESQATERWLVVDKDAIAGSFPDRDAAVIEARDLDIARPHRAPHIVTLLAEHGGGGDAVNVLRIARTPSLDPITVYLEDVAPGAGRATIVCYNEAWTCYWGAMGSRSLVEFIAGCDEHYVSGNMLSGRRRVDEAERGYAARVALAVIAEAMAASKATPPPASNSVECPHDCDCVGPCKRGYDDKPASQYGLRGRK